MTQYQAVLNHLKEYGKITSMGAFSDYGITRLSAIIFRLRKQGYIISTELIKGKNRFGNSICYGKYALKENNNG